MIALADNEDCCGCAACYSACPELCIEMRTDEAGFLYPEIRTDKCLDCGLCASSCPALHPVVSNATDKTTYVVQHKDNEIRLQSTSGGAFTAIAQFIIEQGGVVFGAAFDDKLQVHHIHVEAIHDLEKFRSSKYVQSTIGDAYLKAKGFLDNGQQVCFSGTPCQICGLKGFLRKDYENLLTVDVMCRAVPSPLIYKKYLEFQEKKLGEIHWLRFRDKYFGYSYSTLTIHAVKNGKYHEYHRGIESDLWLRAFFSRACDRPSCKDCQFQGENHQSDFTIWDCVDVWKFAPEFDDNIGSTRMLIQSEKGHKCFEKLKSLIRAVEVPPNSIVDKKRKKPPKTKDVNKLIFYKDAHEMDVFCFFNKYFPYTFKIRALHIARVISYKLKIYRVLKRYVWDRLRTK